MEDHEAKDEAMTDVWWAINEALTDEHKVVFNEWRRRLYSLTSDVNEHASSYKDPGNRKDKWLHPETGTLSVAARDMVARIPFLGQSSRDEAK